MLSMHCCADDQGAGNEGAKEKENPAQPAAKAPSLAGVIKPVPGRSRFNTAMEANPLAALNPRCDPMSCSIRHAMHALVGSC